MWWIETPFWKIFSKFHWFRYEHRWILKTRYEPLFLIMHWRIQGAHSAHAPLRDPILSFRHTNFTKRTHLGSPLPRTRWAPPYGKSWIRHCHGLNFLQWEWMGVYNFPKLEIRDFFGIDTDLRTLADLEGGVPSAHPQGSRFFHFDITKFSKCNRLGSWRPLPRGRCPYGKSWIRHWRINHNSIR